MEIRKDKEAKLLVQDLRNNKWSKYSIDIFRRVHYWLGNEYFKNIRQLDKIDNQQMQMIVSNYQSAFLYCQSNKELYTANSTGFSTLDLSKWKHESTAPCYYIAFNSACAYSMWGKSREGFMWLETAIKMKPSLKNQAKKDPDLDFLKKLDNEKYNYIFK